VKILALDSATSHCSIALCTDGRRIVGDRTPEGGSQGDAIPGVVEAMLQEAGLAIDDLDRLAVTIGPGRFTGLRAGLAFMRGLSLASDVPLIGVTTLEAVFEATSCADQEVALAVIDSKRAELFFQIFDAQGHALGAAFAMRPDGLAPRMSSHSRIIVVGEHAGMVAARLGASTRAIERHVEAFDVAAIAARQTPPRAPPAPLYVHPPATTMARASKSRPQ